MTRRNFILGMFASAALLAVGVRLPRFGNAGSVWIKGGAFSYDCGQSWTIDRPADGTPVSRIYAVSPNDSLFMEQTDPRHMPHYTDHSIGAEDRTWHMTQSDPSRIQEPYAHYIIP